MTESPGESFIEADRRGDAVTLIAGGKLLIYLDNRALGAEGGKSSSHKKTSSTEVVDLFTYPPYLNSNNRVDQSIVAPFIVWSCPRNQ